MSHPRVLVIDDDPGLRRTLELLLGGEGYPISVAADGEEGLRVALAEPTPELILCDVRMPRLDGLAFLDRYAAEGGSGLVIVMSAYGSTDAALEAMRRGAYDYVPKPFDADEVLLALRKAEEREQLRREVRRLRAAVGEPEGFEGIVGRSPPMREAIDLAARVAPYPTTVLLTGESGTGKEMFARALHRTSPRRDRGFVAINCGAIPENLLESELFGHEKGAFTGADRARDGVFDEANGGTLFLDELAELPLTLQVKLLRVLQERTIRRVGGSGERAVDVRVVAATSRDLEGEVRAGRFREDLWYRVNVMHLHLPALRARPEDIPHLADFFLRRHSERLGIPAEPLPRNLLPLLTQYGWPGNVRELENVLERAVILSGGRIGEEHLPDPVRAGTQTFPAGEDSADLSVKRRVAALERELIARALEKTGGNRTKAAEILELSVRALQYKVQDYGLA